MATDVDAVADLREYGLSVLASLIDGYLVTDPDAPNYCLARTLASLSGE